MEEVLRTVCHIFDVKSEKWLFLGFLSGIVTYYSAFTHDLVRNRDRKSFRIVWEIVT